MMLGSGIDPFLGSRIVLATYLSFILYQKTGRLRREFSRLDRAVCPGCLLRIDVKPIAVDVASEFTMLRIWTSGVAL